MLCFVLWLRCYWYTHNISLRCYSVIFEIPRWILSINFIGEKSYFAAVCSRASYPFVCYLTKALGSEPRHKLQMSLFSKIYWSIVQRKWKENTHQVCPQLQNRVNRDKGEKICIAHEHICVGQYTVSKISIFYATVSNGIVKSQSIHQIFFAADCLD